MPRVSVVIPSYNSAEFVGMAVESVMAQTFADFELIVVDDGSTDNTRDVLSGFASDVRFRYHHQANAGVSRARNFGISRSRGDFVAFLDADDVWRPEKLRRQLAALDASPDVRVCHTAYEVVDADLRPLHVLGVRRGSDQVTLDDLLFRGNQVGTPSTVVIGRDLLDRIGGFDPALSQCADWDLWVRLAGQTTFVSVNEPLIAYRTHGGNMSRNVLLLERDSVYLLQKAFATPGLPPHLAARSRSALAWNYVVLAGSYLHARRPRDFVRCLGLALSLDARQCGYAAAFPLRAAGRALSFGRAAS